MSVHEMYLSKIEGFNSIVYFQWHITNQCTEACQHCYLGQKSAIHTELQDCKEIIDRIAAYAAQMGQQAFVALTGGDPLLHPDFFEIVDYCNQQEITVLVKGNPNLLNKPIIQKLKESGVVSYQMSLDGLEKTHDTIRNTGSFKNTLDSFKELKKNEILTVAKFTVNQLNYRELVDLLQVVDETGVDYFGFSRLIVTGEAVNSNLDMEATFNYRELLDQVYQVALELENTELIFYDPLWVNYFAEKGELTQVEKLMQEKAPGAYTGCSIWEDNFCIRENGDLLVCSRMPDLVIGNILQAPLEEIVKAPGLAKLRAMDQLEGCADCDLNKLCRGCRAAAYSATQNYYGCDPNCWRG